MWKVLNAIVVLGVGLSQATVPSYISICHQTDPNLNDCIKNSIELLKPQLKIGLPELDVPPLEPFTVEDIVMVRGIGQYSFMLNLTNVEVFGASDFQLTKLKLDIPNIIYKISVTFPSLRLKGDYIVDTRILSLPIKSTGRFEANATHTDGIGILKGSFRTDKFKHLYFDDLTISLKIGDYSLKLDNTDKKDDALSQAINDIANSNKDELIIISSPFIERSASQVLRKIANQIVTNLEYDEVFPN